MDNQDADARAIDAHIGKRVRRRREQLNMSQGRLGELIGGITFQQVQKYESGVNRIGASRLVLIAKALDCAPSLFFHGLDTPTAEVDPIVVFAVEKGAYQIAAAFMKLPKEARSVLVQLAELLAEVPNLKRS